MKYEITKINRKTVVKTFSCIYFALGLITSLTAGVLMIIEGRDIAFVAFTLVVPVAGFVVGGISGFFLSSIYNLVANKFGGIVVEVKALEKQDVIN